MAQTKKMTAGNPAKLIFFFAIPLMVGNMFQQIYTITDTLIISRTLGVEALAALGSADWFDYLVISMIQAAAQGCSIRIAQDYGAGDHVHLHRTVARSIVLCFLFGAAMTLLAEALIGPVTAFLHTPAEIVWMTKGYLHVKFGGLLMAMLMNYTASVLRAFGNSRTPLHAMVAAAVLNVGLDLLFVRVLSFGVYGAAAATVIAQGTGGLWCLLVLRKLKFLKLKKEHFAVNASLDGLLVKLSVPLMLANILIAVGGIIVQSRVNRFPMAFIAGYTATNKLYGLLEIAAVSYGFAMVTYIGQNYGAGEYKRCRDGYWASMRIAALTSLAMGFVMIAFGKNITGMFLNGEPAVVAQAQVHAVRFLTIMASLLPILYALHVTRSSLQGFGDTTAPMISGIAEFAARLFTALVISLYLGEDAMFWAEIAAWAASDLVLFAAMRKRFRMLDATNVTAE